jgi:hypothetical protein
LPHIYGQNGFRAVARIPWSEEHKPEGWNHDTFKAHNGGRPDVVFMAHDPQAGAYQPTDGPHVADYDAGTAAQHAALAHVQARGNVPAAPGPEAYGSGQLIRMAQPLTVHHGTPHEFAPTRVNPLGEFNLSKMGTGEGAQAYGKGIYQAGNEKVAQGYRDELSGGATYQGARAPFSRDDPHARAAHDVAEYMETNKLTPEQAIAEVEREHKELAAYEGMPAPGLSATYQEASRRRQQFHLGVHMAAQTLKPEHFTSDPGHLYEAELHIHPDHMLDWDKPLHQHSQYVRDRLANHEDLKGFEGLGHRMNGEFVHGVLAGASPGQRDQAAAAKTLLDAGIPGIKYLDADSRRPARDLAQAEAKLNELHTQGADAFRLGKQQEYVDHLRSQVSHNYVVFDPRTINIVKRNGLPAMIDAGADALRDHKVGTP